MQILIKKVPWWVQVLVVGIAGLAVGYFVGYDIGYEKSQRNNISSFEQCADAGYPVQESFPEVCRTPDGRSFTNTKAGANNQAVSQDEALNLIKDCEAVGTYSLHNGTTGLILINDIYQPVSNTTEDYLRQNQNSTCPFSQAAIE